MISIFFGSIIIRILWRKWKKYFLAIFDIFCTLYAKNKPKNSKINQKWHFLISCESKSDKVRHLIFFYVVKYTIREHLDVILAWTSLDFFFYLKSKNAYFKNLIYLFLHFLSPFLKTLNLNFLIFSNAITNLILLQRKCQKNWINLTWNDFFL